MAHLVDRRIGRIHPHLSQAPSPAAANRSDERDEGPERMGEELTPNAGSSLRKFVTALAAARSEANESQAITRFGLRANQWFRRPRVHHRGT
jgi:hypothetical protein